MRLPRTPARRWSIALLAPLILVACGSDDDALTDERGDLNEDFDSVPGATVESPALSENTVETAMPTPFGTVSVSEEIYPVGGLEADGGDFMSCDVDPPEREGFVDIAAVLDERTFAFNVVQGTASATVDADSTVVDDYEINGTNVRGTAVFEAGSVVFDITC